MKAEIVADLNPFTTRIAVSGEVRLQQLLESLSRSIGGSRIVAIGQSSGLPIASLDRGPNTMAATAMATLTLTAAKNVCSNLDLRDMSVVTIEGRGWKVFVHDLGNGFTCFVVANGDVDPGLVKHELERHAAELRRVLALIG